MSELFELNPEEIEFAIVARKHGKESRMVHHLRRPTDDDWIGYDRALNVAYQDAQVADETGTKITDRSLKAACDLWDAVIKMTEGYNEVPVPPAHKQAAIAQLMKVWPAPDETYLQDGIHLDSAQELVILQAERETEYPRLVHYFAPPSPGQHIEYQRTMADSMIIHATKKQEGKVIFPSRMSRLVALYDQLVIGASGYAIGGVEPKGDVKQLRQLLSAYMDAQHKRSAVTALFGSEQVAIERKTKADAAAGE